MWARTCPGVRGALALLALLGALGAPGCWGAEAGSGGAGGPGLPPHAQTQAQLGLEPVLRSGGVHGKRTPLRGQGKGATWC